MWNSSKLELQSSRSSKIFRSYTWIDSMEIRRLDIYGPNLCVLMMKGLRNTVSWSEKLLLMSQNSFS